MDPLSDVLSLVKIRSCWSLGFEWGGDWCLEFSAYEGIRIYAVVFGECWLSVEGVPEPIRGRTGDCIVLPSGLPYRVGSDLTLPAVNDRTLFSNTGPGGIVKHNGGGDFLGIGGHFTLAGEYASLLLEELPPILHIRKESDKDVLRWTLDRLRQELHDPQPGGSLAEQQLATMLLIQALRVHLADGATAGVGWLFALADPRMRTVISAMHADPGRRWTLRSLGKLAGMSRTTFAVTFKEVVGKAPMEYLTQWRMMLAGDRLMSSADSISVIAPSLGYESESAFSTAFKRVMGSSPRQYSQRNYPEPSSLSEREAVRTNRLEFVLD